MKHYNDTSKTQRSYEIVQATRKCIELWNTSWPEAWPESVKETLEKEFNESFAKLTEYIEENGSQDMKDRLEEWGDTDGWLSHTVGIYAMVLELVEETKDYM